MFSKNNNGTKNKKSEVSIISEETQIKGDLYSTHEIHVDGQVEGDIKCQSLAVGKTGLVKGCIFAEDVYIRGSVVGQIEAKSVTLLNNARITGDIIHHKLSVEEGATIDGTCKPFSLEENPEQSIVNFNNNHAAEENFEASQTH